MELAIPSRLPCPTTLANLTTPIQRIHLALDGGKVGPEEIEQRRLRAAKISQGVPGDGAAVRLPGDQAGPLMLAEGPETGLAAYTATGHETWIALGGIGKLVPPAGRRVVVIADDDPPAHDARKGQASKALNKALASWRQADIDLVVVRPWAKRRHDKSDMADLILHQGPAAVQTRIRAALGIHGGYTPPPRVSLVEAERQVDVIAANFFTRVDVGSAEMIAAGKDAPAPEAFAHAVRVDVGVGKSHAARSWMAATIATMRARGDLRTMVLAVPTHALGAEQAAAFLALPAAKEAGLRVEVWRGRAAADPDQAAPDGKGLTMCQDLDRVADAKALGLSVQQAACKSRVKDGTKSKTVMCPLFETCAYQAQMGKRADVWIVPHESLFHEKPKALGTIAAVVVDESAWAKGLIGRRESL